jgi:hypothetical protein
MRGVFWAALAAWALPALAMAVEERVAAEAEVVRIGDLKVIRQGLKTKKPGDWEVYDLSQDHAEEHDLADSRGDLIQQAEAILRREVSENLRFPVPIPGSSE